MEGSHSTIVHICIVSYHFSMYSCLQVCQSPFSTKPLSNKDGKGVAWPTLKQYLVEHEAILHTLKLDPQ